MLSVTVRPIILSVVMLSVIMMSVFMLNVIMLIVVAQISVININHYRISTTMPDCENLTRRANFCSPRFFSFFGEK
jgi:hypothetical protein